MGDARSRRSRRSPGSSGGGSSTWPTSSGSATQTLDAIALHARAGGRPAAGAAVPGGLLPRRARGVVPPPPRGAGPGRRDVRRGRVLQRRHVLPGGGRRALRPALPGRDPAAALGDRGGRRRAGRDPPPPGPDPPGAGDRVAPVPRRQPDLRPRGAADGRGRRAGLGPAGRPDPLPAADGADPRGRSAGSSRPRRRPGSGSSGPTRRPGPRTATSASPSRR